MSFISAVQVLFSIEERFHLRTPYKYQITPLLSFKFQYYPCVPSNIPAPLILKYFMSLVLMVFQSNNTVLEGKSFLHPTCNPLISKIPKMFLIFYFMRRYFLEICSGICSRNRFQKTFSRNLIINTKDILVFSTSVMEYRLKMERCR